MQYTNSKCSHFLKRFHVAPRPKVCSLSSVKLLTITCFGSSPSNLTRWERNKTQDLLLSFSPSKRQFYLENTLLSLHRLLIYADFYDCFWGKLTLFVGVRWLLSLRSFYDFSEAFAAFLSNNFRSGPGALCRPRLFCSTKNLDKICLHQIFRSLIVGAMKNRKIFVNHKMAMMDIQIEQYFSLGIRLKRKLGSHNSCILS